MFVAARTALAAAALPVLLALSSCASEPPRPSSLATVDDACAAEAASLQTLGVPAGAAGLQRAAVRVASAAEAQAEQLTSLGEVAGPSVAVGSVVQPLQALSSSAQRVGDAARAGDLGAVASSTHAASASAKEAAAAAGEAGLSECATDLRGGVDALYAGSHSVVRERFVSAADQLCAEAASALGGLDPGPTRASVIEQLDAGGTVIEKLLADLAALPVPPGDEARVEALVGGSRAILERVAALREAVVAGDDPSFRVLDADVTGLLAAAGSAWGDYGVPACGRALGGA